MTTVSRRTAAKNRLPGLLPRAVTVPSLLWHVSRHDFAARPLRLMLFVLAVAVGVSLPAAMDIATETVVAAFAANFRGIGGAVDLQVTFGTGEVGFPEEIVDQIRALPFVEHAAAVVRGGATIVDDPRETVDLLGVDLMQADLAEFYHAVTIARAGDDFDILDDPTAVIVPRQLAEDRHLRLGDELRMAVPVGVRTFHVRAIVDAGEVSMPLGGRIVFTYLPVAQTALGKDTGAIASNVDRIDVAVLAGVRVEDARDQLQRILPAGFVAARPIQQRVIGSKVTAGLRATLMGISLFALVAAMFLVYSTASALVGYRMPDLAALVTLGVTHRSLVRLVVSETAILGAIGSTLGAAMGVVLARLTTADVAEGMSLNYAMNFSSVLPAFRATAATPWFVLLGTIAAVCSAWVPASRLRRVDPIALRRSDGASDSSGWKGERALYMAGSACACVGVLAMWFGESRQHAPASAAGSTLSGVALVLLTLPAARIIWSRLRAPLSRMLGVSGWFASEQVLQAGERTMVTVGAIALSIGVVLTAATLPSSFRGSVVTWYGFRGDLIVASRAYQGGWLSAPVEDSLAERLESLPGVSSVDSMRVMPAFHYAGDRLMVVGITRGYLQSALAAVGDRRRRQYIDKILAGRGVLASENMARRYGVSAGQVLSLPTPTGVLRLPVLAVVPDFVSDRGSVLLSRDLLARRWNDQLVNYIALNAAGGASIGALRRAVGNALEAERGNLTQFDPSVFRSRIDGAIAKAFADVQSLKALVLIVTLAGILDLLVSNVLDRRRLYGTLQIVGAFDRMLSLLVVVEAAIISFTAGMLGALIGAVASWMWIRFTYPLLVGYTLSLHFAWGSALTCGLLAVVAATMAGAGTVRIQLRSGVIEAMRAA